MLSRMQLFVLEHRQDSETVFNPIKNGKEFLNGRVLLGSGIDDVSRRPFLWCHFQKDIIRKSIIPVNLLSTAFFFFLFSLRDVFLFCYIPALFSAAL